MIFEVILKNKKKLRVSLRLKIFILLFIVLVTFIYSITKQILNPTSLHEDQISEEEKFVNSLKYLLSETDFNPENLTFWQIDEIIRACALKSIERADEPLKVPSNDKINPLSDIIDKLYFTYLKYDENFSPDFENGTEELFFNPYKYRIRILTKGIYSYSPDLVKIFDTGDYEKEKEWDYFDQLHVPEDISEVEEIKSVHNGDYIDSSFIRKYHNSIFLYTVMSCNIPNDKLIIVFSCNYTKKRVLKFFPVFFVLWFKNYLPFLLSCVIFSILLIRPISKISKEISSTTDSNGRILKNDFSYSKRRDEIGDLSRSYSNLINKLNSRINETEMLSADLSHEIKNPLAAIRNLTETLNDETLALEERHQLLEAINQESIKIEKIIKNIRDASKIENKAYESEKEDIPCDQMLHNLCSVYIQKYPKIEFETELNASENKISISPELFETMITNLIVNAVTFGTKILITSKIENRNLIITVEDNGPGVPEIERNKIFNRFYSNRPKEDKSVHDGLGLHLVQFIANSVNGKIEISDSEKLGGACFSFCIKHE